METLKLEGFGELMRRALPAICHHKTVPVALQELYSSLVTPLVQQRKDISDEITIQAVPCGSPLVDVAQATVDYAYSLRFANGNYEELRENCNNSQWILAVGAYSCPIVWGTLRIAWGPGIDIFELFEVKQSSDWLYERQRASTMGRISFSPAFDAVVGLPTVSHDDLRTLSIARMRLTSALLQAGLARLTADAYDRIYFIATEALSTWFSMCGLTSFKVSDANIAATRAVIKFRKHFPGYWESDPCLFEVARQEPHAF